MVGAAGPPVMLDSGVAVATTGKVVRLRGRDANTRDAPTRDAPTRDAPTRDGTRYDPLIAALEQHGDLVQIVDAFDVEPQGRNQRADAHAGVQHDHRAVSRA